jgi:hypothetical protein
MEKTTPAAQQPTVVADHPVQAPAEKKGSAIVGTLKVLLATKTWSKQASILKKRGSFPLLRSVLKNNVTSNRVIIPTAIISDYYIAKSIIGHRIILAASSITFIYGLMLLPRGIAIWVKQDAWLNASLVLSIPLLVYSGMKILMSLKVLKAFNAERKLRVQMEYGSNEGAANADS